MESICLPAKLYFIITIVCCVWYYNYYKKDYKNNKKNFFTELVIDILLLLFFTWFLNYLCISNYKKTSWFLFIIYLMFSVGGIYIIKKNKITYAEVTGKQK